MQIDTAYSRWAISTFFSVVRKVKLEFLHEPRRRHTVVKLCSKVITTDSRRVHFSKQLDPNTRTTWEVAKIWTLNYLASTASQLPPALGRLHFLAHAAVQFPVAAGSGCGHLADNMHISLCYVRRIQLLHNLSCKFEQFTNTGNSRATGCISCIFEKMQPDGKWVLYPFKTHVVHKLCDKDREARCYRLGVKDIGRPPNRCA